MSNSSHNLIVLKDVLLSSTIGALREKFESLIELSEKDIVKALEDTSFLGEALGLAENKNAAKHAINGLILGPYTPKVDALINAVRRASKNPWIPIAIISEDESYTPFGCSHFHPAELDGLFEFMTTEHQPSVLIIEDDRSLQDVMNQGLSKHYSLTSCMDGKEGFEAFKSGNFDLVITDYMLPNMTGSDILERIRLTNTDVPVIVITAFHDKSLELTLMNRGATDYLPKPFLMRTLKKTVVDVLTHQQEKRTIAGFSEKEDELAWDAWRDKFEQYRSH